MSIYGSLSGKWLLGFSVLNNIIFLTENRFRIIIREGWVCKVTIQCNLRVQIVTFYINKSWKFGSYRYLKIVLGENLEACSHQNF